MKSVQSFVRAAGTVAFAACAAAFASQAQAGTLYATGFEEMTTGAAPTGWLADGTGTGTVQATAGLANTGNNYLGLTPPTGTAGNWRYRPISPAWVPNVTDGNNALTISASLAIFSPASGTANRGVHLGLQSYTSSLSLPATILVVWDATNAYGFGANHYLISCEANNTTPATDDDGFLFDLGAVTSAQLTDVGYLNFAMTLNYDTGVVEFFESGDSLGTGLFDVAATPNFGEADIFFSRISTGGTLPRLVVDDYSIVSHYINVPEPTTLAALGVVGLIARRRRA